MLALSFKNEHIYFLLDSTWEDLDYRFKAHINDLCSASSDEATEQTINIPVSTLLQCFKVATVQPEGVASFLNSEMLTALVTQVTPNANIQAVQDSITARNTWQETTYMDWYNNTYLTWLATHPATDEQGNAVTYTDEPVAPTVPDVLAYNEEAQVLININVIDQQNKAIKAEKIQSGKAKILKPQE